jgi:hypothetical protein
MGKKHKKRNRQGKKSQRPSTYALLDWKPAFLAALGQAVSVTEAAKAAGVGESTAYTHRRQDPEFAAAWLEALSRGTETLEAIAVNRAKGYRKKVVTHAGKVVWVHRNAAGELVPDPKEGEPTPAGWVLEPLYEDEHSDTLLIFLLKARRPELYRERLSIGGDATQPPIQIEGDGKALDVYAKLDELTRLYTGVVDATPQGDTASDGSRESVDPETSPGGSDPAASAVPL